MIAREIIREIKQLGVYSPEQLAEYQGYFRQKDELSRYLQKALRSLDENVVKCG